MQRCESVDFDANIEKNLREKIADIPLTLINLLAFT